LKLKLEKLRAGKTFEELDEDADVQTEGLLKDYVTRIQELECELLQMQNSRFPSIGSLRPVSSQSSDSFEDSVSGIDFGGVNSDGSIFLTSGKTCVNHWTLFKGCALHFLIFIVCNS
jgi:hypothetical protein